MDGLKTTDRSVCVHGGVNSLELEIVCTEDGYTVKATQAICQQCLRDLGMDLAQNNLVLVDTIAQRLQRYP